MESRRRSDIGGLALQQMNECAKDVYRQFSYSDPWNS